ncbi:hypothetical protein C8R42DRAFT_719039 [Lentinula raphanica]|nr:hypothetical protein C8R42DRAFT_719039 [Lentinula raphanica]
MPNVMDNDSSSSPYQLSSDAGTPNSNTCYIQCRSTKSSVSIKQQKIDGEPVEEQDEDELMLWSSSQTGSKRLHQLYDLGLDDSQLKSYPYYQNMRAFNDLDDDHSDNELGIIESQRGRNGYGYDLQSDDLDTEVDGSPQIKSEPKKLSYNDQAALDRVLAENRSLSAQITNLCAQNRILLDIIQWTGNIFLDITHASKRLDAPAGFRDTLNAYFLDNGVEESQ